VALAALALRIWRLDALPIGGDESVYLRWSEIAAHQGQWFISLLDGKQPLCTWLYALAYFFDAEDPVLAARWYSALAGAAAALGIYAVARRLGGEVAGLVAGGLYVFLPYGLFYDRLAYAEALVNLSGVVIVYASLRCFRQEGASWIATAGLGSALGLGFLVKSTTLLFWFFAPLAALWLGGWRTLPRLVPAYAMALVFPLISWAAVPRAPMMATHSLIVHQTSFFLPPAELLRNPLAVAPQNLRLMGSYLAAYITAPAALAALVAVAWLLWRRSAAAAVLISFSVLPLAVQIFLLQKMFPSRYPFPHVWPWLVVLGMAAAALPRRRPAWLAGLIAVPLVAQGIGVLVAPDKYLYEDDAQWFLGSGPAAGWGLREAAAYLRAEARAGEITVLTDPIWGPPADSMFVYLNGRDGVRVYEAWWTTISPDYPILPAVPVELVKSHYERVPGGVLDPRRLERVYYVTETHYTPEAVVRRRQPNARRLISFPKPNGRNAIEVYRLR
jgi:4-amino-4-deoxy-L-arabinose transferase-like glycosyltransferase